MTATARLPFDEPQNPLHWLTPEQIEEIGRELDELHEQVKADLGERDATYIRSMIAFQRRLALIGRGSLIFSRWRVPWALGAASLGLAKILENMEIGHNVLHGQWDWMNDPVINSRAWDWDTASTAEAWRHSHNYVHHTYTNIRGKDRDLGYEIMRIDPQQPWNPVYLFQPFYNLGLMALFEWGVAVHDLDLTAIRAGQKDLKAVREDLKGIAGKARTQIVKDYVAADQRRRHDGNRGGGLHHEDEDERPWSRPSGRTLKRAARKPGHNGPGDPLGMRPRQAPDRAHVVRLRGEVLRQLIDRRSFREPFMRTLTADVAANVIRNVWAYAIIFCGHFPDQTYTFTAGGDRRRDARRLVRPPADRRRQHRRRADVPRDQRQPRLPGRASPVPGHAEHAIRGDRAAGAGALRALRTAVQLGAVPPAARDGAADDPATGAAGRQAAAEARRLQRAHWSAAPASARTPGRSPRRRPTENTGAQPFGTLNLRPVVHPAMFVHRGGRYVLSANVFLTPED